MPTANASRLLRSGKCTFLVNAALVVCMLGFWGVQSAYAGLNVSPTSWNVIGLDSNDQNVGPNTFQVGARVCNTGAAPVTNVSASFVWDSFNSYINLSGAGTINLYSLASGACIDFHFPVVVTRTSAAFDTARRYHITVSGDSVASVSTPTPRELYVEHIISQGRNSVNSITGPTTVYVGQTYNYTVNASTATQGYQQLEAFLELSNVIFQVQAISTTYSAPSGATNDKFYADACGWDNNPLSGSYRSCIGPENYSGGKAGGNIVTTYTVKVLSAGATTAGTTILDFSGSSYHYNSDYGAQVISITALPPPLTLSKIANPTTATAGATVTYTLRVANTGPTNYTLTDFIDTPPTSPATPTYVSGSSYFNGASIPNPIASGSTRTWTGSYLIPPGQTRDLTYQMIMPDTPGTYVNTAIAHFNEFQVDTTPSTTDNAPATASVTVPPPDLSIAKTHTGNFTVGVNGAYTLTASNTGSASTSGTITVSDNLPTGLTVASIPTGTGWNCSTTVVGSSTATCTSSTVIAAGATSPNPITLTVVVSPAAFAASPVTNVANISGGGENNAGNNSANDPTTINGVADLSIAKVHTGNFTVGVNGTYTLTASNPGTLATSGTITVTDNLPTGLTVAAIPTGTGWDCSTTVVGSSTATCTSSTVIAAGATSPNPITLTVVVSAAAFAASPVTNVANISGGSEPAYNNGNNSASDPTTINGVADLAIAKSHSGNFTVGVNGTYTLTASNPGTLATSGTITVTDNLPTGLTVAALPTGTGWNCATTVVGSSTATCTSSTVIAAGATSPNPITLTVVVSAAAFAASPVTNVANISGGSEPAYNNGNNSASDPTTIDGVSDVSIAKSHTGNFTVGINGTYTLTASNPGTLATSGTITVTDNLPTGLTVAALPTGTGWNCSTTVVGSSTATCTSSTVIAAGATSPNPITLTVVVSAAAFAASPVTNVANISGGGEPAYNNGNNSASDPTTIDGVSDVSIAKSHTGNFTVGINGTYTLTASNPGTLATSGTITVTDNLPTGLTVAALPTGTGWNCATTVVGSSTATCTSSDVIAAGATSPNPITLTVVVSPAAFAASPVTNVANISGGGEPAYNNGNNSASDPTTINGAPDLTIAKTHTGNFTQGQTNAIYSITATNSGTAITSGMVTVTDTLPTGLTATDISGAGWSCVLGTLTCTRNDALAAGASYAVITLTVNVSLTAPASVTNSATVSGGGENNASNNTANDLTTIDVAAPPSIGLLKSVSPGGSQIPGGDLLYTIVYSNTGGQPANNFIIDDPNIGNVVPAERVFRNVDFKVGSLTSNPGPTGLVATFEYSNDGGTTWTYTPLSGAGGAPSGYDRVVTNVRWSFAGSLSQTAPNNSGSVGLTVRIR